MATHGSLTHGIVMMSTNPRDACGRAMKITTTMKENPFEINIPRILLKLYPLMPNAQNPFDFVVVSLFLKASNTILRPDMACVLALFNQAPLCENCNSHTQYHESLCYVLFHRVAGAIYTLIDQCTLRHRTPPNPYSLHLPIMVLLISCAYICPSFLAIALRGFGSRPPHTISLSGSSSRHQTQHPHVCK